jgi:DNA-binding transcriptional LysR family regulator
MFELRQLRYFVAVAETEHVGRAAEILGISQPPLSRQIQQLEARLGLTLFLRDKKRLRLTPAGQNFLTSARELLAHASEIARATRS